MTEFENQFIGGLDLESDFTVVESGFYTYLLNGTTANTFERNRLLAEAVKSNVKKTRYWDFLSKEYSVFQLPSGTNKCIGVAEDIQNSALVFFNYNSNGHHAIYRFWPNPDGIQPFIESLSYYIFGLPPITWGSVLNFQLDHKIFNAKIMETATTSRTWTRNPEHPVFGNEIPNQLLWFTDGFNPERRFMLSDLYLIVQDSLTFDEYWINTAKQAPQKSPSISMDRDSTQETNYLKYKHYQFRVRYKYKDGEYSTLSPISDISLLVKPEYLFINFDAPYIPENNVIVVSGGGPIHDTVDKIEVFVRTGDGVNNSDTPEWYRFAELERGVDFNSSAYQIVYRGNEETFLLSRADSNTNFYNIPLLARHQELVDGNHVVYADCVEGQDPEPIDAEVSYIKNSCKFAKWPVQKVTPHNYVGGIDPFVGTAVVSSVADLDIGDIIFGTVTIQGTTIVPLGYYELYNYYYTIKAGDHVLSTFIANLAASIQAQTGYVVSVLGTRLIGGVGPVPGKALSFLNESYFGVDNRGFGYVENGLNRGFKEGAIHKLGIVHFDSEMRQGNFEELPDLYIPFITETYPRSNSYTYQPEVYGISIKVNSKPPLWAKYYKIVHKCSIQSCAQYAITAIGYEDQKLIVTLKSYDDFLSGTGANFPPNWKPKGVADYVSSEWVGAKIRFMTKSVTQLEMQDTSRQVMETYVESKIKAVDSGADLKLEITDFGYPIAGIGSGSLVEIYPEGYAPVYFELPVNPLGNLYGKINNAGTETRSYDFQPGSFNTYAGNIYKRWRVLTGTVDSGQYFIESFSISDWWASKFYCKGRVQAETPNMKKQRIGTMLRWSGKLFQNTNINNTNVFDEGNYKILETKFGSITGIRQVGYTLKAIMWRNVASAFIGRREVQNADGSTQLVLTDSLIGNINYSEESYGCKNPESIYMFERRIYFFDVLNKAIIRNDPNGSDNISKRYAQRWWQDVSDQISENGLQVIAGMDPSMNLIYWTIKSETEHLYTISYADEKRLWHGFHSFLRQEEFFDVPVDFMGNIGAVMICFLDGEVWQMNDGSNYLNLFGQDVPFRAGCAVNIEPKKIKLFRYHSVRSNRRPNKASQFIVSSETNLNGMESYVPGAKFIYKEGIFHSSLNRNINSFGVPSTLQDTLRALISGIELRGHVCNVIIEFTGNEPVHLKSLVTGVIPSEKS